MAQPNYEAAILEEEQVWRKLAKAEKLKFVASRRDGPETLVQGRYLGHDLSLKAVRDEYSDLYTFISLSKKRPLKTEIKRASLAILDKLVGTYSLKGTIEAEAGGTSVFYRQPGFVTDKRYLRSLFQLLYEILILYPQITGLAGEAIPHLQKIWESSETFQPICTQMMVDIGEASQPLENIASEIWCSHCLTHFESFKMKLPNHESTIYYYWCRACGQSREFLHLKGGVTAILDNTGTGEQYAQGEGLNVNWLHRRSLFDFDRVEIIQATDEEVERFAVSLGNDTDETRRARYQEMEYVISPSCELSPNTLKVLQYTFRQEE